MIGMNLPADAQSTLSDSQVLVVYNSALDEASGGGGQVIFEHYRTIPGRENVLGLDLNDPTLLPGNISYAEFKSKVRDPIRHHLIDQALTEQVLVILLTRGIPTRIADFTDPTPIDSTDDDLVADRPLRAGELYEAINATYASIDSELALLYQDLDTGEAGGGFDSNADNFIRNPYFNATSSIATSDRGSVQSERLFRQVNDYLQIRPIATDTRQLFLTCRLDGNSVADVVDALSRAQRIYIDPDTDHFIIDEYDPAQGGPGQGDGDNTELDAAGLFRTINAGGDFDQLANNLNSAGFAEVDHDEAITFLIGTNGSIADPDATPIAGPVAAVFTFGGNHSTVGQNGYLNTFIDSATGESQFVPGAYFSSIESYNAREFGGLPQFTDQGSIAEFIAAGGTFGVGTVFEPFTPAICEVDILIDRHLNDGFTFVEAAFAALPFVSSPSVIVGDPLAKPTLGPRPVPLDGGEVELAPIVSFQSEPGVQYTVLKSADGRSFTAIASIRGTGLVISLPDTTVQPNETAIYRVERQ